MTGAALAGAIEICTARFRISRHDIQCSPWVSIACNGLDTLMQEMRKVDHLRVSQRCLVGRSFLGGGTDAVSHPVSQDDRRADQIRTAIGSLRRASMAVDAVLGVDETAAIRGGVINALPFGRPCLRREKYREQQ